MAFDESGARLVPILGAVAKLRVSGGRDERIAAIALLQRGRVSRRQLLSAGISYGAIARRVERGLLWPLHRGRVFAVGQPGPVALGDETAALLAMRPGTVLSFWTAGGLWEMVRSTEAVHVTVPGGGSRPLAGLVVHRSEILTRRDVRVYQGLPITSPARTLLDLAVSLHQRHLERALERMLMTGLSLGEVAALLGRTRHPGRAALRAAVENLRGPTVTRSEAEERFLALVREAGLPDPEVNVKIAGYEVDFLWRAQRIVVEVDGFRFHSTARRFEHDHRKDAILRAAGLEVRRFTFWQIQDEPLFVVAAVARGL